VYIKIRENDFFNAFKFLVKPLLVQLVLKYSGIIITTQDINDNVYDYFIQILYNGYFSKNTQVDLGDSCISFKEILPKAFSKNLSIKRRQWHAICKEIRHHMKTILQKYIDKRNSIIDNENNRLNSFNEICYFDGDEDEDFEVEDDMVLNQFSLTRLGELWKIIKPPLLNQIRRGKQLKKVKTNEKMFNDVILAKQKKMLRKTICVIHYNKWSFEDINKEILNFNKASLKHVEKIKGDRKLVFRGNGTLLWDDRLDYTQFISKVRAKIKRDKKREKSRERRIKEKEMEIARSLKNKIMLKVVLKMMVRYKIRNFNKIKYKANLLKRQPFMSLKKVMIYRKKDEERYKKELVDIKDKKEEVQFNQRKEEIQKDALIDPLHKFKKLKSWQIFHVDKCTCNSFKFLTQGQPRSILKQCPNHQHRDVILTGLIIYKARQAKIDVNILKKADSSKFKRQHPELYQ
jgi:hypothetical protein